MSAPPLRPYQQGIVNSVEQAWSLGARSPLVQAHTGLGKTRIAAELCKQHVAKGGTTVLFVVHRRELALQAMDALDDVGLHENVNVRVRTIQELTQARALIPPASLVVLDEAHHYIAQEWRKIRDALPCALWLGLSATPERGDGLGLDAMFDTMVMGPSIKEAVRDGWLVPCETYRPSKVLRPRELAQDPVLTVASRMGALPLGGGAVLFAPSVDLARLWAAQLRSEHAIEAEAVWGDMLWQDRERAVADYRRGETRCLVNVQILTEGWDAPHTSLVVLGRSFGTVGGLLQAVGRGLRPWLGKERCILVDLTGCTHALGDVDEDRTWHLDGKAARRASDDIEVRFCPLCGAPSPVGQDCGMCGYTGERKQRKPRVLGLPVDRFARQRAETDEEKTRTLKRWLQDARNRGYKPGWAFAKFTAVYGMGPSAVMKRDAWRRA